MSWVHEGGWEVRTCFQITSHYKIQGPGCITLLCYSPRKLQALQGQEHVLRALNVFIIPLPHFGMIMTTFWYILTQLILPITLVLLHTVRLQKQAQNDLVMQSRSHSKLVEQQGVELRNKVLVNNTLQPKTLNNAWTLIHGQINECMGTVECWEGGRAVIVKSPCLFHQLTTDSH